MSRLVVVSNRVADPGRAQASGELAACLPDALRERGGIWFGWNGELVADESEIAPSCVRRGRCTRKAEGLVLRPDWSPSSHSQRTKLLQPAA